MYPKFVEETSDTLKRIEVKESSIKLRDFRAHFWNDAGLWKGVIGQHDDADVNDNGRLLLQNCDMTTHWAS